MVKINIVCIGKIKDKYIKDGIDEFRKRLSKYVKDSDVNANLLFKINGIESAKVNNNTP